MTEKMMTPLRQHMIDEMTIRNLSPSSEQGLARSDAVQHIGGAPAVMSLTLLLSASQARMTAIRPPLPRICITRFML